MTYDPGWEADVNGRLQPIRADAIGQMVIAPDCRGACEVSLRYTGGAARVAARGLSAAAMLLAAVMAYRNHRRSGARHLDLPRVVA